MSISERKWNKGVTGWFFFKIPCRLFKPCSEIEQKTMGFVPDMEWQKVTKSWRPNVSASLYFEMFVVFPPLTSSF